MSTSGLSALTIAKISAVLGSKAQPHFSDASHSPTPTNCMIWRTPATRADVALSAVRAALTGEAAIAYKHHHVWLSPYESEADGIVACPSTDQFDSIRVEMGSKGFPDGDEVIAELMDYDREFGVQVDGAHYSTVEFRLLRVPPGREAEALGKRIFQFSPDIFYSVGEQTVDFVQGAGRIVWWWD